MIKKENKIKYKIKTEQLRINQTEQPVSYTHLDVYKRQIKDVHEAENKYMQIYIVLTDFLQLQ